MMRIWSGSFGNIASEESTNPNLYTLKSKDLLDQLADLESALSNFSFEELNTSDAKRLKKSFDSFRNHLENKIWGDDTRSVENEEDPQEKNKATHQREEMLIATVSHEIRTPLSGIVGFADLLQESDLTVEQEEQVRAIRTASDKLMDIINELLEYSKLSAGLEHFENIDFNFNSIIQDVGYLCNTLMLGKDVQLRIEQDPQIPEVLTGDPSKLSQVLLNLLGNSIKFVESGTIHLNISHIRERKDQIWLEFVISDTGIGISEEDLKHIFESFRQAKQQNFSKFGGTGLGLHIVKQIVEKLNGELEVSSRLGVGTTFRFTLAFGRGSKIVQPKSKHKAVSPDEVKGLKVLVFEDNLMNQRLIEQRLKAWGCRTYITENAKYGLNLLENAGIDMVLMDLRMPIMNGFEVTRKIRANKNDQINSLPIIALTADFTVEDKDECALSGINDYLLKPFNPADLLSKIVQNKSGNQNRIESARATSTAVSKTVSDYRVIDLKPVLEDCMGNFTVLREIIDLYKQNALEFIGKVKIHLANEDFVGIRNAAHKIKCGLAMMQTHSLHFIVEQMHNNCRTTRDIQHLKRLYNCFVEKYPEVEKRLDEEFRNMMNKSNEDE